MHEATCLPCVFGCNALPSCTLASINTTLPNSSTKDETAHYLICPIMLGIISQASGLGHLPTLHELIFRKDSIDLTGALACVTSYHIYHSVKFGKWVIIKKAIETGMFSQVRAYAFSSAQAFLNDYDIKSKGAIFCCGNSGLQRDSSHLCFLANSPDQAVYNSHSQGTSSLDS